MAYRGFSITVDVNFNGTMHFNMVVLRHFMKQNESGVTPPKGGYTSKWLQQTLEDKDND